MEYMPDIPLITTAALQELLASEKPVNIIDVRPVKERAEWFIPGSLHIDAYDKLKQNDPAALDALHLDKSVPVITVCAAGRTSQGAADILLKKGYNACSLEHGMKGWTLAWNLAREKFDGFIIFQVRRTGKGCLSYIVVSGEDAIIIDASLPREVYEDKVRQEKLSIKYVLETHIHADHLSRSKEIAAHFNAPLFLPALSKVKFDFNAFDETTSFPVGNIIIQPIATPGHTLDSFSFYIDNEVIFTGDTLFTDGVGRPDLKSSDEESRNKTKLLYHSLQKLISLPENVIILPAHTSKPVEFNGALVKATIGQARRDIELLQCNEEEFTNTLLQKIPPTPPNYLAIVEKNVAGDYMDVNPIELEAGANRCAIS
jgi:glyoxylase-like metal-dependent hydrolase (beta-lactamase superfamily II)/rhodanese-related sulfurtransferase